MKNAQKQILICEMDETRLKELIGEIVSDNFSRYHPDPIKNKVFKRTEAAKILGVAPNTVESLIEKGLLFFTKDKKIPGWSIKQYLGDYENIG